MRSCLVAFVFSMLASVAASDALAKKGKEPLVVCPPKLADVQDDVKKRKVQVEPSASVQLAARVIPDTDEPEVLRTAKQACREVSYDKPYLQLPAFLCMGDASERIADTGGDQLVNHTQAYCAYDIAARLAAKAEPQDASTRAAAAEGRAKALIGLRRVDGTNAQRYANAAVRAYKKAIELEPTADRHFALGYLHIELRDGKAAENAIEAGAALQRAGTETALAYVALADLQMRQSTSNAQIEQIVIPTLRKAVAAEPKSASANGALGTSYYLLERKSDAKDAFLKVIAKNANDDTAFGYANYRADAHYYLALIESGSERPNWNEVLTSAELAIQLASGGDDRYRSLVCLAYIARGGKDLREGKGENWCQGRGTPQASLMRGMYLIRRAQHVSFRLGSRRRIDIDNEQRYRDYLGDAEDAFDEGVDALEGKDPIEVVWPAVGPVELQPALQFGKDLVRRAEGFCRAKLPDAPRVSSKNLYDAYRLLGCKP